MTRAWGVGTTTVSSSGVVLDAHFRHLGWADSCPPNQRNNLAAHAHDARRGVEIIAVVTEIDTAVAPQDAADVYLRLHLLSHRLAKPRTLNLDGAFGLLANVAWTSIGPVALDVVDEVREALRRKGEHLTQTRIAHYECDPQHSNGSEPIQVSCGGGDVCDPDCIWDFVLTLVLFASDSL